MKALLLLGLPFLSFFFLGCDGLSGSKEEAQRSALKPVIEALPLEVGSTSSLSDSQSWGAFQFDLFMKREPFSPFGSEMSNSSGTKKIISWDFTAKKGSHVYAPLSGKVVSIQFQNQWWEKDYEIVVEPEENSHYQIAIDHILDPTVKQGDIIKAGQILGKIGNMIYGNETSSEIDPQFGIVEIQINYYPSHNPNDNNGVIYQCPGQFIKPELTSTIHGQLSQLMGLYEKFKGKEDIYQETNFSSTGCYKEELSLTP